MTQSRGIPEADWKRFRELQAVALERFCQRVLDDIERLAGDKSKSAHERYAAVYRLIQRRDRELADAFDSPRRSTAFQQLALLRRRRLVTDEEMAEFTEETRAVIESFLGG